MNKSILHTAVCVGSLCMASANAQESQPSGGQMLEEVIVTAQKRAQSVQDIGLTVTAFTGKSVQKFGMDTGDDIAAMTPGLIVSGSAAGESAQNYSMRGIGLNDFATNNSSPVAVHLDEVFLPSMNYLNFGLYDLERVEVLKGPQGTLFGRNTTGGAVNFYTKKPADQFEAGIHTLYGEWDRFDIDGYVSGPISDTVAYRLSGFIRSQDGGPTFNTFLNREVGETDEWWNLRGQLRFEPTDEFDINIMVYGGVEDRETLLQYPDALTWEPGSFTPRFADPANGFGSLCAAYSTGRIVEPDANTGCIGFNGEPNTDGDFYKSSQGLPNAINVETLGLNVTANYDLDFATLTSVSSYIDIDRDTQEDCDASDIFGCDIRYLAKASAFSQELRLASKGSSALEWTVGISYGQDELDDNFLAIWEVFGGLFPHRYKQDTTAYALFGQVEYELSDRLSIIGGLRYSVEDRDWVGGTQFHSADFANLAIGDIPPDNLVAQLTFLDTNVRAEKANYKLGVNYDVSNTTMLYASYTTGFKGGGVTGTTTFSQDTLNSFDEENLAAVEVGIKAELFDNRIRWNTSAFYYDYEDVILQINETVVSPSGADIGVFRFQNGGDAEVYGIETEFTASVANNLIVQFGGAWQDSEIVRVAPGNDALLGNQLTYAPDVSLTWLVEYTHDLTQGLSAAFLLNGQYNSDREAEFPPTPISSLPSYHTADISVSILSNTNGWKLSGYVRNVTDEYYISYLNDLSACCGNSLHTGSIPRNWGVEFTYSWGD